MEKCTFCIQRIRRSTREAGREGRAVEDGDRALNPACVNACPTETLVFGNLNDPDSKVSKMRAKESQSEGRGYALLEELGTNPNVVYLKKVEEDAEVNAHD